MNTTYVGLFANSVSVLLPLITGQGTNSFVSHFLLQTELTWTQNLCKMHSVESWVLICHTLAKCTSQTEFNQSFVNKCHNSQVSGPV